MATFTPNYNLRKPEDADFAENDTDLNANWDKVDTEMKQSEDAITALETKTAGFNRKGAIFKAADESVASSTTLQDDNDFTLAVVADRKYIFEFLLIVKAGEAAADFKYNFSFPTSDGIAGGAGLAAATASGALGDVRTLGRTVTAGTSFSDEIVGVTNANLAVTAYVVLVPSASGTFKMQWAQNTSDATATTLAKYSAMKWEEYV